MESIKELRARCQSVHADDFSAQIVRAVSIYFTAILIRTPVTANAVSVGNAAIAVAAGVFFAQATALGLVLGVALFTLNTILDGVDGEIARYRRQSSLTGLFADRINSVFAYPALFGGLGFASFRLTGSLWGVLVAVVAPWASIAVRLAKTTLDTTLVDALTQSKARQEDARPVEREFVPLSEEFRHRSRAVWVVDFFLFRQPGVNIATLLGVGAAVALMDSGAAAGWILCTFAGGYGAAYALATIAGVALIVRGRRAEAALQQLQAAIAARKA